MMELQELVVSIQQIKASSSELSGMVSAAGQGLSTQARNIAALTRPSQSGQQAAMAVSTASQAAPARGVVDENARAHLR